MAKLKSKRAYEVAIRRMEELLPLVTEETASNDPKRIELHFISDLIYEYEQEHYPIPEPTIGERIERRMKEMHLRQNQLADILGMQKSRLSEIINGKSEPTLTQLKTICQTMSLDPNDLLNL